MSDKSVQDGNAVGADQVTPNPALGEQTKSLEEKDAASDSRPSRQIARKVSTLSEEAAAFPQRAPGEPVNLNWREQVLRAACCDCGLTHSVTFRVKGETLTLRARINKRLTLLLRKSDRMKGTPYAR